MTTLDAKPMLQAEADQALSILRGFSDLVLAVSGGPDSLALLALVAEWRQRLAAQAPTVLVATVDHGLRPESAAEARHVAHLCQHLGLQHETLHWTDRKPVSGIADAARQARYALLGQYAERAAAGRSVAVVTAHHQDDQAETVMMRLHRGGGVFALAAMAPDRPLHNASAVRLVRPLLNASKAQLIATVAERGWQWCEDPTNVDRAYERPRIRQTLDALDIQPSALATTARRMRAAADGLGFAASALQAQIQLETNGGIYAKFARAPFDAAPAIVRQIVLARLIGQFGGNSRAPELSELEALASRFDAALPFSATLGGAVTSAGTRYVRLWREPGRIATASVVLRTGQTVRWDERFLLTVTGPQTSDVHVRPVGVAGADALLNTAVALRDVPAGAIAGLPAFSVGSTVLGTPFMAAASDTLVSPCGLKLVAKPILHAS